jgi:hypothetical protein
MTLNGESENRQIGRVLRASTTGFAVGSRVNQLSVPAFGSLVKAQPVTAGEEIYGLIYNMNIDDDPVVQRLVMAESPPTPVIEDQRRNRLLPIEMSVLAVGYRLGDELRHALPPRPPLNLDPVVLLDDPDEVIEFTDHPGYLRLILRNAGGPVPVDQLLVAHIRQVHALRGDDDIWAAAMVEELIDLLRSNYELLVPTLEAVSDALPKIEVGRMNREV